MKILILLILSKKLFIQLHQNIQKTLDNLTSSRELVNKYGLPSPFGIPGFTNCGGGISGDGISKVFCMLKSVVSLYASQVAFLNKKS